MSALYAGFLLGLSLIAAIGAQNAFVLRQGLQKHHVFAVCLVCALSDTLLIVAGVSGFGLLARDNPALDMVMRLGGAAFLIVYSLRSLRRALSGHSSLRPSDTGTASLTKTITTCLAFTWLNPHVYLDTLVLLGSLSTAYEGDGLLFALGAIAASFLFFFSLGFGARLLLPLFINPRSWRVLDLLIALVMLTIALGLLSPLVMNMISQALA